MKRVLLALLLALSLPTLQAEEKVTVAVNPMEVDPAAYLDRITLPPGFQIHIYATGLPGVRSLSLSPSGVLYAGTMRGRGKDPVGKVYAVEDTDHDMVADKVSVVAGGLNYPNGVAWHEGDLYVAEISRILRIDNIDANLGNPPSPVIINDDYPKDFHHGWKFIRFGPDGKLYVPVGAPCNICETKDPYATITRLNKDGSQREVYARGVRNSVGFDWHPVTGELWFTDNGRDLMGNDLPPGELNRVAQAGQHFGFPYRYGRAVVDDTYHTSRDAGTFQPAALDIPAHSAPLGMRFYTGSQFPDTYHHAIIMTHHGSWNRNPPQGYKVAVARVQDNQVVAYEPLAEGWLQGEKFWGRPVDVEQLQDGSVLVSDDFNGVIYRISYRK